MGNLIDEVKALIENDDLMGASVKLKEALKGEYFPQHEYDVTNLKVRVMDYL